MCHFYNAQLFEITGAAKDVFTHSQSSCHIAKVVLTIKHDSRPIPIASDARLSTPPALSSIGGLRTPAPRVRRATFMEPGRVDEDVAILIPHSPGCADFPLPVLHGRVSLAKVWRWTIRAAGSG